MPDEQLLKKAARRKRLFAEAPTDDLVVSAVRRVFDQSLVDLDDEGRARGFTEWWKQWPDDAAG